jgi:ectoine hydroxylase-related dioxygenase (phytanoyl-CoA dioxygenase family)
MTVLDHVVDLRAAELPPLTTDLEEAKAHLDELGVARIAGALDADELAALNDRLREQAAAEREAGVAFMDGGGANQRVWNLPSKGRVFRDLLTHPVVRTLARHILDGDYLLSSHTANITGPGGSPMVLHTDQGFAPRQVDLALTMNVMWMLVDFTDEIGATRLVPGSHKVQAEPPRGWGDTVAGVGPAGTALVFDGRIWHGTGANTTADLYRYGVLTYFARPWIRQQEQYVIATPTEVADELDDELQAVLGFRTWRTLGGVQGPWGPGTPTTPQGFASGSRIRRDNELVGELRPSGTRG